MPATAPERALERAHVFSLLLLLAACPGGTGTTDATTDAGTTETTTTTTEPTTAAPPTTSTSTDPSTGTTTGAPACLNGVVDPGEACDDGNDINGDGCNNDCTISGELLWEYVSGVPNHDAIRAIAVDADGIIVGARTPGLERQVARFDFELEPQWSQIYGPGSIGIITGVALAPGAIYAAGARASDMDNHDTWLARLAPDGALEWEDSFSSGFGNDWLTQVAVIGDGDVVVTGLASTDSGRTDLWTRRYAADMSIAWTAEYPVESNPDLYPLGPGLAVTPGAVVAGWNVVANNFAETLFAYPHGGGAPLWIQMLPATSGNITSIALDPGGDLVLAGIHNFEQLTVRRTAADGTLLWSSHDCTGRMGRAVAIDSQGDIVVIGDGPGAVGMNIRLCKFTAAGELRWGKDIDGGFGDDRGFTVAIGPDDRIIAGGWMLADDGQDDAWLAVYSP